MDFELLSKQEKSVAINHFASICVIESLNLALKEKNCTKLAHLLISIFHGNLFRSFRAFLLLFEFDFFLSTSLEAS
jgi:hypothetical protein